MPELPEVETIRRYLAPRLAGAIVRDVVVHDGRLRRPVPRGVRSDLPGQRIERVDRRGKYLLLSSAAGTAIVHLGMSGSLRLTEAGAPPATHDRIELLFAAGQSLRFNDPRRFGSWQWARRDPLDHPALRCLGPEPLDRGFDGRGLRRALRRRSSAVKLALLDQSLVAGVGNIYASEALFAAGVRPTARASSLSPARCDRLAVAIKQVLAAAIACGGTTLDDEGYASADGTPGRFQVELMVYGRAGEPCRRCGRAIRALRQGQRTTYFCPRCQR
ncbi:MAG: bifunctional DNA-formamidopyrimidine glycosylase/DNA-(apurinic or apyrimidinic site) lyase [Deltaproteobacteria bacterium]|nr:bifunctional DNA-formamidopyrimidine glycosylase/DNA-(apurinic or apyrimidinic site) lyase [Deltaproteobacteria bacterium]